MNADAPAAMAQWAARRDIPMIHFSTDYLFDGSGKAAWREDDAPGHCRFMAPANFPESLRLGGLAADI